MTCLPSLPETATRLEVFRAYPDLDHLVLAPTRGRHAHIDQAGGVTLRWPHHTPLLADVPARPAPGLDTGGNRGPASCQAAHRGRVLARYGPPAPAEALSPLPLGVLFYWAERAWVHAHGQVPAGKPGWPRRADGATRLCCVPA